jgi:hypothetical protein
LILLAGSRTTVTKVIFIATVITMTTTIITMMTTTMGPGPPNT